MLFNSTSSNFFKKSISNSSIIEFDDDQMIQTTKRFQNLNLNFVNDRFIFSQRLNFSFNDEEKTSLINAQRMLIECQSNTLDIDERVWKCWIIQEIVKIRDDIFQFNRFVIKYLNAFFLFKQNAKLWFAFMQKVVDVDLFEFTEFDEIKAKNFDRMKKWLKFQNYERNNLKKSCKRLEISWRDLHNTMYKIDNMIINIQFRYWQSIAVNWMFESRKNFLIKECILDDYMNIDKIIEILKYLTIMNDFHFQLFVSFHI